MAGQGAQMPGRRDEFGRGRRPPPARTGTARKSGCRARKASAWASPSSGSSEQVQKTSRPPGSISAAAGRGGGPGGPRACGCPPRPSSRRRRDGGGWCPSPSRARRGGRRRKGRPEGSSRRRREFRLRGRAGERSPPPAPGAGPNGRRRAPARRRRRAGRSCRRAPRKGRRPLARLDGEETGRQGRGGILNPERALRVAGQLRDRAALGEADAAGRQQEAAEALRPGGGSSMAVRSTAEARWAAAMAAASPRRNGRSSAAAARRACPGRDRRGEDRVALPRHPAQDRVDEALRMAQRRVGRRELDGGADRGVVGHVEDQDLRRPDGEEGEQAPVGRLAVEAGLEGMADRAEAAEGDDGDRPRERQVAGVEPLAGGERGRRRGERAASGPRPRHSRRAGGSRAPRRRTAAKASPTGRAGAPPRKFGPCDGRGSRKLGALLRGCRGHLARERLQAPRCGSPSPGGSRTGCPSRWPESGLMMKSGAVAGWRSASAFGIGPRRPRSSRAPRRGRGAARRSRRPIAVGVIFPRAADRHLDHRRRERREERGGDHDERVRPLAVARRRRRSRTGRASRWRPRRWRSRS